MLEIKYRMSFLLKKHHKCDRVTIDPGLSFDKHISKVCSSCALHTKALRHIRLLLDVHTANAIACSLIGSRLDYCNALLAVIAP